MFPFLLLFTILFIYFFSKLLNKLFNLFFSYPLIQIVNDSDDDNDSEIK